MVEIAVALAVEVAEAVDRVEVVVVVVEAAESSSSKTADLYKVSNDANTIYEKKIQVWKIWGIFACVRPSSSGLSGGAPW